MSNILAQSGDIDARPASAPILMWTECECKDRSFFSHTCITKDLWGDLIVMVLHNVRGRARGISEEVLRNARSVSLHLKDRKSKADFLFLHVRYISSVKTYSALKHSTCWNHCRFIPWFLFDVAFSQHVTRENMSSAYRESSSSSSSSEFSRCNWVPRNYEVSTRCK